MDESRSLLIFGSSGNIGSALASMGWSFANVFCMRRAFGEEFLLSRADSINGDLTIMTGTFREVICHIARQLDCVILAVGRPRAAIFGSRDAVRETVYANVVLGKNIVRALRDCGARAGLKVINLSSIKVFCPNCELVVENSPVRPSGLYAWSKLRGEKRINQECVRGNFISVNLRLPPVVGTRPSGILGLIFKFGRLTRCFLIPPSLIRRTYISVEEVRIGIEIIVGSEVSGVVLIHNSSAEKQLAKIVELLGDSCHVNVFALRIPDKLLGVVGYLSNKLRLGVIVGQSRVVVSGIDVKDGDLLKKALMRWGA